MVGHLLSAIDNRGIKESLISLLKDYSDKGIPITLKRFKSAIDKISRKSSETLIRDIDSIIFNSNKDTPRGLYKEIKMKTAQLIPDKTGARSYVDMMFKKKIAPNNVVFNQLNSDVTGEKLIKAAEDFLSLTKIDQVKNTMKGYNNNPTITFHQEKATQKQNYERKGNFERRGGYSSRGRYNNGRQNYYQPRQNSQNENQGRKDYQDKRSQRNSWSQGQDKTTRIQNLG